MSWRRSESGDGAGRPSGDRSCADRPRGERLVAVLTALALALTALVAAGCSGDDDGDPASSSDVPSGAVAKVGDREIGEDELEQQVEALARAQRSSGDGRTGGGGDGGGTASDGEGAASGGDAAEAQRELLRDQALATLLMREAIEQEAAERGVKVSDEEVAQRWEAAAGSQFKTEKALRRFLGGQTEQDVLDQLRLQMLSEGIAEQISEEAGGGKQGQRAVRRFQREFQRRWADRTACAEGYDAPGCAGEPE